jgi:hypothetical protein
MPQIVFLDECHTTTAKHGHPIYSVGGVSADTKRIGEIEEGWRAAKVHSGLAGQDLKFAMSWPDGGAQRLAMIEAIGSLPLRQGVIALLEDFRPKMLKLTNKEKRGDLYVHRGCFDYVLQRLRAPQYEPGEGIHLVAFDLGDHFPKLDDRYREVHPERSLPWGETWPSLRDRGYSESLAATRGGPLNEIADLVVGSLTRWAACRCGAERGKSYGEREELDRACQELIHLFPTRPSIPEQWTGWSFIVFTGGLTGKEQLKDGLDGWLRDLKNAAEQPSSDEIPF